MVVGFIVPRNADKTALFDIEERTSLAKSLESSLKTNSLREARTSIASPDKKVREKKEKEAKKKKKLPTKTVFAPSFASLAPCSLKY